MKTTITKLLMQEQKEERRKKIILIIAIAVITVANMLAQTVNNSIVVFSEDGERITLILNGIRQNTYSETNVKAAGLNQGNYKAKVIFDRKGMADCDKTIPMMWGGEAVSNTEFVFSVAKDKKGNYKWKFISQGPVSQSTYVAVNNTQVSTADNTANTNSNTAVNTNTVAGTGSNGMNMNVNTNVQGNSADYNQVNTTTTTTSGTGTSGANISMGVNGLGVNLNLNVNDGMGGINSTTTTTTTYSTSTTTNGITATNNGTSTQVSTGLNGNIGMNVQVNGTGTGTATSGYTGSTTATTASSYTTSQVSGSICGDPMSYPDFEAAKKSVNEKSFEDTKLSLAKQIAANNCLSSDQIKSMMALFSFEESKLDFAKYCYGNCYDKKNYYKINDVFTFDASTAELNEYVKSR